MIYNPHKNISNGTAAGFTVVELMVVIIVIGILASAVIFGYNGAARNAIDTTLKSDLQTAAGTIESMRQRQNSYPLTGSALIASEGNTLNYESRPYGYCITATNPKTTSIYQIKSNSPNTIIEGACVIAVSTFAGSGTGGFAEGTGSAAQFNSPLGLAVDRAGNTYVTDRFNNRIRKITTEGVVSTFAGSGVAGYADGTGAAAQFSEPMGLAIDSTGNLYVGGEQGQRIRKITPNGVVTTLAGSGSAGYADGTGTAAQFAEPMCFTVDSVGNVYVCDRYNHRIRKITPAGVVTTVAGSGVAGFADGTGTAAQFNEPTGLAVDKAGNLYVGDRHNNRIRKITPAGVVTTFAGSGVAGTANGYGTAAQFYGPMGLVIDSAGSLYVADRENNLIRKVTATGLVTTIAGSGAAGSSDGVGTAAQFNGSMSLAIGSDGNLYVGDYWGHRVRKIIQ